MVLPPLLLFVKDVIAINAVLATEPGITARTVRYFAYSQLPGALLFDTTNEGMFFNYVLAFLVGGLIWFLAARRSRRRATQQIVGPERRERVSHQT